MRHIRRLLAQLCWAPVVVGVPLAAAQTAPKIPSPLAQFWLDVATHNLSIPGMEAMEESPMTGMMGNFFGAAKGPMGSPGKWLDTALYTRDKPGGSEAQHGIPAALQMGPSLPLVPVQAQPQGPRGPAAQRDEEPEKPKGRMLFYWGCSDIVRPGQPRVIDFAKATPQDYASFMVGRFAPDRGAKAVPGRSVWPNPKDSQRVPRDATLVGEHMVSGEGVPPSLRFALSSAYDFMPRLRMAAAGDIKAAIPVTWEGVSAAQAYFLTAMGSGQGKDGAADMIIWSSSTQPDPGWGLMDYLTPARVEQLLQEKVVLAPDLRQCDIPAGIFASAQGAMVRMIAYGPELNLTYPPRPSNPKLSWDPQWSVRLRLKSTSMTLLGEKAEAPARRARPEREAPAAPAESATPLQDIVNPVNVLRGLFGR